VETSNWFSADFDGDAMGMEWAYLVEFSLIIYEIWTEMETRVGSDTRWKEPGNIQNVSNKLVVIGSECPGCLQQACCDRSGYPECLGWGCRG
jgi:hypothetical protein